MNETQSSPLDDSEEEPEVIASRSSILRLFLTCSIEPVLKDKPWPATSACAACCDVEVEPGDKVAAKICPPGTGARGRLQFPLLLIELLPGGAGFSDGPLRAGGGAILARECGSSMAAKDVGLESPGGVFVTSVLFKGPVPLQWIALFCVVIKGDDTMFTPGRIMLGDPESVDVSMLCEPLIEPEPDVNTA